MRKMSAEARERLNAEVTELKTRHGKLKKFLMEHKSDEEDLDIRLLRRQAKVMSEYADILDTRIKLDDAKTE